jgi:hypothetical protein
VQMLIIGENRLNESPIVKTDRILAYSLSNLNSINEAALSFSAGVSGLRYKLIRVFQI